MGGFGEAEIYRDEKTSRDEEIDWLSGVLARLERGKTLFLVAEVGGRVLACSDITCKRGMKACRSGRHIR